MKKLIPASVLLVALAAVSGCKQQTVIVDAESPNPLTEVERAFLYSMTNQKPGPAAAAGGAGSRFEEYGIAETPKVRYTFQQARTAPHFDSGQIKDENGELIPFTYTVTLPSGSIKKSIGPVVKKLGYSDGYWLLNDFRVQQPVKIGGYTTEHVLERILDYSALDGFVRTYANKAVEFGS